MQVGADTRFVVRQIRPVTERDCTAVDFRWDFQAWLVARYARCVPEKAIPRSVRVGASGK